ncbi:MAG: DUF1492 domain-containing protein [Lachnospiraceae bacterium]|nr:DUF1492 domain-containing protein [Lachnospiraceae bacterium]
MTAKEQLQELRRLDAEINNKIKELEQLRQRAVGVGGFDYSKDRVVSSPSGDALPDMVSRILTLDEQINDMIDELADKRREAYQMICRLDSEAEQDVLYWRYIRGQSWRRVAEEMNISVRQAHYKHGDALAHLEDKI